MLSRFRPSIPAAFQQLACAAILSLTVPCAQAREYLLAVVPQLSPAATSRTWGPFAERLGRETGTTLRVRVYRTFDEFETELAHGVPDLVYLNPYQQIRARRMQGYVPLVRDGSYQLSGVLVVRRDSPVQSVTDLNGQEIGFPDANAFAASLYMRALLQQKEKIRFTSRYYMTHGNVYRHVITGDVLAGSGVNATLESERPETRHELRVVYQTPGTAPHPLSAHPRVPERERESIIAAILRMQQDADGRESLKTVHILQPVRADYARDYAPLEKWQLHQYTVHTKLQPR
jgi:ABC-type phosphate/phosphonate transport system substrate-binding protein